MTLRKNKSKKIKIRNKIAFKFRTEKIEKY